MRRGALAALISVSPIAPVAATDASPGVPPDVVPSAVSDLLVVLDADGRSHVAQHALSSEGALLRLSLPPDVVLERVRFSGPERETFASAHRRAPERVSLWSGSALVRYRGVYGDDALSADGADGRLALRTASVPDALAVEDGELALASVTWAFPDTLELVSFTSAADGLGKWRAGDGLLSFESRAAEPTALRVVWRRRPAESADGRGSGRGFGYGFGHRDERGGGDAIGDADACARTYPPDDACLPDTDADGVPDHRDVCPAGDGGRIGSGAALAARIRAGTLADGPSGTAPDVGAFGCPERDDGGRAVTDLDDVVFAAGASYLDLAARESLDRLAEALEHALESAPGSVWEIAAHTDGDGSRARNRELSEARAEAVRRYLMLRGIGPNRLRARGHGEARPLGNESAGDGRRGNRRIEIVRIDRAAGPGSVRRAPARPGSER